MLALNINDVLNFYFMDPPSLEVVMIILYYHVDDITVVHDNSTGAVTLVRSCTQDHTTRGD